jgi:hypothetical protein
MTEPFRIKRSVKKDTPDRVTALWLLGFFLILSIPYLGIWIGYFLYEDWGMWTYLFGLVFSLFVGGVIAWFTLIIQENAQDIQIRVVQQK